MHRKLFVLVFLAIVLAGCAGPQKYVPQAAPERPDRVAFSFKHPIQWEKEGAQALTFFKGFFPDRLFAEGGTNWIPEGRLPDGSVVKGEAQLNLQPDPWGNFMMQYVLPMTAEEAAVARFFLPNRDNGWAFRLDSAPIPGGVDFNTKGETNGSVVYDPKKYDSDKDYQAKFFQAHGMSLSELDGVWVRYFRDNGLFVPDAYTTVQTLAIGSAGWQEYKSEVNRLIQEGKLHAYTLPDGELRFGYMPLAQFRREAVSEPGFNGWNRYKSQMKISLSEVVAVATGIMLPGAGGISGGLVGAMINDQWTGHFGRATVQRKDLGPAFEAVCDVYRQSLTERNEIIRALFEENERLKKGGRP